MKPSILITYRIPEEGLAGLLDGYALDMPAQGEFAYPREQWLPRLGDYDAVLLAGANLSGQDMLNPGKMRMISNYGAGYDNIDIPAATKLGIVVSNIPESTTESTAELAFGLMMTLSRRISEFDRRLRVEPDFQWGLMRNLSANLFGRTLGILGMGRIGQSMARRAIACGMRIIYHNRHPLPQEQAAGAQYVDLATLLAQSDILSVHCPLTDDTRGMLGMAQIQMMKPSALIINTARGGVFDETALVLALQNGTIAGAGLDVYLQEPAAIPKALFDLPNVVLTPHVGTDTVQARLMMAQQAAQNLVNYFDGRPTNVVNPEVLRK